MQPALYPQSNRATEQQSNRALCRSRDITLCCLGSRSRRTSSLSDPLPEASSHYPPPSLAQSLELDKRVPCPRLLPSSWFRKDAYCSYNFQQYYPPSQPCRLYRRFRRHHSSKMQQLCEAQPGLQSASPFRKMQQLQSQEH